MAYTGWAEGAAEEQYVAEAGIGNIRKYAYCNLMVGHEAKLDRTKVRGTALVSRQR